MSLEVRRLGADVTAFNEGTGLFDAVACVYNFDDSYGTRFLPGAFTKSLNRSLPELRWEHQRRRVGEVVDWRDDDERLVIIGQLDPPTGPNGKLIARVWKGLRTEVLREFSVGFNTVRDRKAPDGIREIIEADLGEVSVVLEGAVVGSELLTTRSAQAAGGPIYSRVVTALGGIPAIRTPASDPLVDEAAEILDRIR